MTTVSRTFTVDAPPEVVVPYLADFGNAVHWDPGTVTCARNDSGPIRTGANWHNTSKIAGITTDLTYTLEQFDEDRLVLVGRNDTATSTETIEITPNGAGSSITYTNELEFKGAAKLAAPLGKVVFEKLGNDTEKQLTEVLNKLAR
ncbi:SRPBCC family protein [Kibdelosporangium phytohabitans]|uniref:Polyketide cyclase n=1 Tax=Kibdelosporangium phytohabitans TaxID=860235 RepID=A0A0N9HYQ1_9PSEU|nr:SRPBCC family protein [Kibdelosporangium phytohabitans]ALG12485.1 polyketide cyclase [Kibdelosporangium phytohabitans]MBE1464079.1 carbon monoxide dehydrogenase subunit G [Kibdelosporangium phytohabitans]